MSLNIYNTLTRKKEEFKPIHPPKVNMYVCGVTVYDDCHLGHARALINFDVIYRYLKFAGYEVNYVRNFTDIDDKIIKRANELNVDWTSITAKYIDSFNQDMEALNNQKPTLEPKATENIDEIIKLIQGLMDKGFAYLAGKDVFYSVRKKQDYGKLSGKKIDELESGARIEIHDDKKDPLDFCLWKSSKPGEPSWESPFGPGRPGWHIECSAMSMRFLGENFDIHGGGRDLSFPHHENEIAQSEAYSGKTFANYWVHNGFININAEKMSKSLGNFTKIKELLELYHAEILRLFILSSHYRSPIDYYPEKMKELRKSLTRWYSLIDRLNRHPLSKNDLSKFEKKLLEGLENLKKEFILAMNDDFNSAKAIGYVFEQIKEFNKLLDTKNDIHPNLKSAFFDQIKEIDSILGLFGSSPESFLMIEKQRVLNDAGLTDEIINQKLLDRKEARESKNWLKADEIRNELADLGIQIKDHPDGSSSFSF